MRLTTLVYIDHKPDISFISLVELLLTRSYFALELVGGSKQSAKWHI